MPLTVSSSFTTSTSLPHAWYCILLFPLPSLPPFSQLLLSAPLSLAVFWMLIFSGFCPCPAPLHILQSLSGWALSFPWLHLPICWVFFLFFYSNFPPGFRVITYYQTYNGNLPLEVTKLPQIPNYPSFSLLKLAMQVILITCLSPTPPIPVWSCQFHSPQILLLSTLTTTIILLEATVVSPGLLQEPLYFLFLQSIFHTLAKINFLKHIFNNMFSTSAKNSSWL